MSTGYSHEKSIDSVLQGAHLFRNRSGRNTEASFEGTLIMSTNCEHLKIEDCEDLRKDILKVGDLFRDAQVSLLTFGRARRVA